MMPIFMQLLFRIEVDDLSRIYQSVQDESQQQQRRQKERSIHGRVGWKNKDEKHKKNIECTSF